MLAPGQGAAAVNVAQVTVDHAVWTVSLLGIFVFVAFFMLIILFSAVTQSVTDFTLVFPLSSNIHYREALGTTGAHLTELT